MSKINQRESVYVATMNVLADHSVNFDEGQDVSTVMTKDIRKEIVAIVTQSIMAGETEFSAEASTKHDTEPKVRAYTSGLVNNWHRKDKRFNGGTKYEAKNPGSRTGSSDEQIKALKTLRTTKEGDEEALKVIDAAITERKAELANAKAKVTMSDAQMALIPADLKAKLGL